MTQPLTFADSLPEPCSTAQIDVDMSDPDFMDKVEKAKEYIVAGDVFQIVLSRCFKRHYSVAPLDIYKTLCQVSPSLFMFIFRLKLALFWEALYGYMANKKLIPFPPNTS